MKKEKRHKLSFKAEKCVYLGISKLHSHDTHKLLNLSTNKIIYRRNVSFNERSFPARHQNPTTTITPKKGSHLIGKTFKDDGEEFLVTNCSFHQGVECLDYKKNCDKRRSLFNSGRSRRMDTSHSNNTNGKHNSTN